MKVHVMNTLNYAVVLVNFFKFENIFSLKLVENKKKVVYIGGLF